MHLNHVFVALVVLGLLPSVGWASGPPVGRVDASHVEKAWCYGWSTATDTGFVMRQKETCAAEGCTLGAYLARVGPNSRAQTVSYVGVAKNPAGRADVSVLVASAKPKFVDAASDAVAKEADLGCLTEAPNVSVAVAGHEVSGGSEGGAIVVRIDGRAITVGTLAATPFAEQVEAIHYAPGHPALLVRVRGASDVGSDVRFVHVSASKLGIAVAKAPTVPPSAGQAASATQPPAAVVPPADPLAVPHTLMSWPTTDRCIGWSKATMDLYVVRERRACTDEQSLDCSRSAALMSVGPKRAKALRALFSNEGDGPTVDSVSVPEGRLRAVSASSKADLGCHTGASGLLPNGKRFTVTDAHDGDERAISLTVGDGAPTVIGVLTTRERREDMYGDVHPGLTETVAAVYSHPEVEALVVEVQRTTDSGFDSRFIYLGPTMVQPRAAREAPVAVAETAEEASRRPITRLAVPMPGRRCLGWSQAEATSSAGPTAYVVAEKDYCIDAGGEQCDASVTVQAVATGGARTAVTLASAHGDMNVVDGRLVRAATDAALEAAEATMTPLLALGCVVGERGVVAGKPFEVLVDGRKVAVSIAGGAAKQVLTLGRDTGGGESEHFSRSSLSAV
jgi:hypothetical protein